MRGRERSTRQGTCSGQTLSRGRPLILRHMLGSGGLNFLDIVMYLHLLWLNKSTFLSDHAWS